MIADVLCNKKRNLIVAELFIKTFIFLLLHNLILLPPQILDQIM